MTSGAVKAIIAIVVVVGLVYFLNDQGLIGDLNVTTPTGTTPTPTGSATYTGILDINENFIDSATNAVYGDDTEVDFIVFNKDASGTFSFNAAGAADTPPGDTDVAINPNIKSVYYELEITSGQAYYVDQAKTIKDNSRVLGYEFLDISNDGRRDAVFQVDVTGHNPNPGITPSQTITFFLIDEGSLDVDSPADISAGTSGKQRCNIKWSLDMDNSGDGEYVTRVRLTANATSGEHGIFVTDSNIQFPTGSSPNSAKQKVFLSEFEETQLSASSFQWDWDIGADVDQAHLLLSPLNGETQFEVPFEVWLDMTQVAFTSDLVLQIQTVDAQGAYTTNSDQVQCNNA